MEARSGILLDESLISKLEAEIMSKSSGTMKSLVTTVNLIVDRRRNEDYTKKEMEELKSLTMMWFADYMKASIIHNSGGSDTVDFLSLYDFLKKERQK